MNNDPTPAEEIPVEAIEPPTPNRAQRRAAARNARQAGSIPWSKGLQRNRAIYLNEHPADTYPGRTAREWFAHLRGRLLASRPMLEPARVSEYPTTRREITTTKSGKRTVKRVPAVQRVEHPPVFGKPTFKNHIDENGVHA